MSPIYLENNYAKIVLSEAGEVLHFIDKIHGSDILSADKESFCSLIMDSGEKCVPDSMTFANRILTVHFKEAKLELLCETYDSFFVFTVLEEPKAKYRSFRFADFRFHYDFAARDTIVVSGYARYMR